MRECVTKYLRCVRIDFCGRQLLAIQSSYDFRSSPKARVQAIIHIESSLFDHNLLEYHMAFLLHTTRLQVEPKPAIGAPEISGVWTSNMFMFSHHKMHRTFGVTGVCCRSWFSIRCFKIVFMPSRQDLSIASSLASRSSDCCGSIAASAWGSSPCSS